MTAKPPLPEDLWAETPPDVQAAILALVRSFERRIAVLEAKINQNSSNSSRPPSTEPIHVKRQPPRPTSKKRRGGQPGHERHTRELVPVEQLTGSVEIKPPSGSSCGHALDGDDPDPVRHQVAEPPEIRPEVIEYRLRRLTCIDRGSGGESIGRRLLDQSRWAFTWWRRLGEGSIARPTPRSYVAGLKGVVGLLLREGSACGCAWTAKACRKILEVERHPWTFAGVAGVAPDNNAAERALRHGVIWRNLSLGTASEAGSRFVERLLSGVETCRQGGRSVAAYLTACFVAKADRAADPVSADLRRSQLNYRSDARP